MGCDAEAKEKASLLIGMPVHNGAAGISRALESLLAQDYSDFDLLISDNASTDKTPQIVEALAKRDRRVRLIREEENRGPTWNFNRLLHAGRSHRFFMWAAHDDFWSPMYVSACISTLEAFPSVVLCGTRARMVTALDDLAGEEDSGITSVGPDVLARALRYVELVELNSIFYGIYRTSGLPSGDLPNRVGGDQAFVLDVALNGELITLPDVLLTRKRGGASRTAASIYRALGLRRKLPARLFRLDVYKALLSVADSSKALTNEQRRVFRRKLIEIGLKRHVLDNLQPRRLRWWLTNGGRARSFKA